jgi:YggT family protein
MLTQAVQFILNTVLGLFVLAVLLRFYLQLFRAPYRNPVSQFVAALTDFGVKPLRRIIPGLWGADLASLVLAWLVEFVLLLALGLLGGISPGGGFFLAMGYLAAVKLLKISIYIVMGAVFIQAVMSWVNPYHALSPTLDALTRPFLRPVRRVVPPVANVDLSPLVLFLIAQLILMLPVAWLESLAGALPL